MKKLILAIIIFLIVQQIGLAHAPVPNTSTHNQTAITYTNVSTFTPGLVVTNPATGNTIVYTNTVTAGEVFIGSGVWALVIFFVYDRLVDVLKGKNANTT